jgi:crotonobetainyl-CoA:carnitine CoA-transferase CaiB-like acyl-CoA transferase
VIDHEHAHERAAPMRKGRSGPLTGVRIVDVTRALAGPFSTMLLADLGADVIKVEPPEGDLPRFGGPFTLDDTERSVSGYFGSINRNKRGVMLDLKDEANREKFLRLCDSADALVENLRAGVMDRLGFSYEALAARNPRLVYAAIRGFGDPRTGESPYVDWPAFDVVAQAVSGVVSITGTEDGQTVRVGPSIGDLYPATLAAVGLVSAVLSARETGKGQFLDVAMYDALVALCEAVVYRYSYTGMITRPTGNSHPQLSPFDIYPTADGGCAIAAPTDNHWAILCDLMGRPDLLTDERSLTNRERVANAAFICQTMSAWTAQHTTAQLVELLGGQVPVGPVNSAPDLFEDPHLRVREMLVAVDQPGGARPVVFANTPIKLTGTPGGVYRRAPRLGEHNEEIFAELDEIERRRNTHPPAPTDRPTQER